MQRRNFLKIAGGGVVLSAGGAGLFAATRTPEKALAPWNRAGGEPYEDPRLNALSYAILAPNPHNRQPWLVSLEGDDEVILRFDQDRQLPHTDPFDRQLAIGLGCFLELMVMAANANGHSVEMDLFPDGYSEEKLDDRIIARAKFSADDQVKADILWPHIMDRRSNKEPFNVGKPVAKADFEEMLRAIGGTTKIGGSIAAEDIEYFRLLSEKAMVIEIETPRTYKESVDLFRIGKSEINANPDGIDFSGVLFESLGLVGAFTREAALDTNSTTYQQGIAAVLETCRTAMGHVWMITDTNTREDQIIAGRDWLRINLAATKAGLSFQPLSQALQEYREMEALYDEIHDRLAPEGGRVQMLSRIGYGPTIPVSPRWPLETRLMEPGQT